MQKLISNVLAFIIVFILPVLAIAACVGDTPEEEAASKPKQEAKTEEAAEEEKALGEAAQEAKEVVMDKPGGTMLLYTENMTVYFTELRDAMSNMGTYNQELAGNPLLIRDESWIIKSMTQLYLMGEAIKKIQSEPVPEAMTEPNKIIQEAMNHYMFAVDNYPTAIDNMDIDLMTEVAENLNQGSTLLAEGQEEVQTAVNKHLGIE